MVVDLNFPASIRIQPCSYANEEVVLDRLKTTLLTAFVLAIFVAPTAFAQATAARVNIISGNGQLVCPGCSFGNSRTFYPLVVKVTDASGNPIAGKTVNWTVTSSLGPAPFVPDFTITDNNGLSIATLNQAGGQIGSAQFPILKATIVATVDGQIATFNETQALVDINGTRQVSVGLLEPVEGQVFSGPAGSTSTSPVRVRVDASSAGIPNVSVRFLNPDPANQPSASCATSPGADPGSVLTDESGFATCYPVFGSVVGKAPVSVIVGGLDPLQFDQTISPVPVPPEGIAYAQFSRIQLNVSAVTPGRITKVSGDNQSVNPGQSSEALVALVQDGSGVVNIANIPVQWTVSPIGAASLSSSTSTTNDQGRAQTTVIVSPNAVGQITVKGALTGANSAVSTTFTLSVNIQISSLAKVSGDTQTAPANQNFTNPLVVQVIGSNGQPVVGQPVSFVVSGGSAVLSSSSANTDGNGRAQVTVRAGATAGTVTVSAAVGTISQNFTLTVIPPGPSLSSNSFFSVGGTSRISALAPCSLVTVVAAGLAPNIQNLVLNSNGFGPWATTVGSDSVSVNNVFAPIASVGSVNGLEQITFQVPCDIAAASSVPVTISVGGGTGTVNMPVLRANPGILETLMSDGTRRAVVVRPDGTFVSLQNPARRGEVVRVFVTGLGATTPAVGTGSLPVPGADALVAGTVIVGVNNGGTRVVTSRLSPNLIGIAEVAFEVPSNAPTGNDVVLSVAVDVAGDPPTKFSNGSKLPIQ
jgi:uncharacterized protein (TIGR03437 family)